MILPLPADPPLDPSGDEARRLLGRELAHPEYHRTNLLEQVMARIRDSLDATVDAASGVSALTTFAAIVAFLLLAIALAWLLSRARRTARAPRRSEPAVPDRAATAAQLRAEAERALAEGRHGDAVVEGFRALAVRQVERGRLDDRPGATAHEVATALAAANPEQRARVDGSALLFDAVRYGDRPATREQAAEVLALDDALTGRR